MTDATDYYRILHVSEDAPQEIIRASYRALMQALRAHPDLGGDTDQASLINEAYATLGKPARRSVYDAQRRGTPTGEPAPPPAAAPARYRPAPAKLDSCLFCGWRGHAERLVPGPNCLRCRSPLEGRARPGVDEQGVRALERLNRHQQVELFLGWPGPSGVGRMENVSLNGMLVTTPLAPTRGALLKLECDLCQAVGQVAHVGSCASGYRVGIEFRTVRFAQARGGFVSTQA